MKRPSMRGVCGVVRLALCKRGTINSSISQEITIYAVHEVGNRDY